LAAGLRPNPLGELTALPQIQTGRGGMGGRGREGECRDGEGWEGRDGEGRDRPTHFLVASAAYERR